MAFASSRIGAQEAIIQPCDLCEDDENVNWFCKDCDQNLCDRCKRSHLRSNISKSHIVLSVSEGFEMGKKNISNMCRDHNEPFLFFCRTCGRNICAKCLSTQHKKHDFIDLRELQLEVRKEIDDVINEKEDEIQKMTKSMNDLDRYEKKSDTFLKERYACIDKHVKAIQVAAVEEGDKLKKILHETKEHQDKAVKEGKHKLQAQIREHKKEVQTVQQELRLQTTSLLKDFVKQSKSKLQSLGPLSITVPNIDHLFSEGKIAQKQIQEMIGNVVATAKVFDEKKVKRPDKIKCNVFSDLEIMKTLELNTIGGCRCMCLSPDGSIWIGGDGYVCKMNSDCSAILHKINARAGYICGNIACLQSGDAVVSYGGVNYVDKFTSFGSREEFNKSLLLDTYDIIVPKHNDVIIDSSHEYIIVFSKEGNQRKRIKVNGGIETFCADSNGDIIISHRNSKAISVLDLISERVKTTWFVAKDDIERLTCDRFGNILATDRKKSIYLFGENGDIRITFTVDCDKIRGICVNQNDHLMILIEENKKSKILVAMYLE